MRGDGRRADVDGDAERALRESGIERDDLRAFPHGGGDFPIALAQGLLQAPQYGEARARLYESPLRLQRHLQAAQIAGRVVHVGLGDLDVIEP